MLDKKTGRILNPNMIDFKWRTFLELPVFDSVTLETSVQTHRFQSVGVGEIMTSPAPPAVLMAVSNALGRRILDYPITPEKVLGALGKQDKVKRGLNR